MRRNFIISFVAFIFLSGCALTKRTVQTNLMKIDFQGHRGCRGLLPENTIPAFIKALDYVSTLECDIVVSKDKQVIVSHDPWIEAHICSHPNGTALDPSEDKTIKIMNLNYAEIKQYDCGQRGNPKFPEQVSEAAHKPSLKDMVKSVDQYCKANDIELPWYDVEIKSLPSWYGIFTPHPDEYVDLILAEIKELGIKDRVNLQSFDINILEVVHKKDKDIVLAYLIDNLASFDKNMDKLSFTPDIYSPYYRFVTKKLVDKAHSKDMKVIPWTVNDVKDMQKLIGRGVDGIITDYPNRISSLGLN